MAPIYMDMSKFLALSQDEDTPDVESEMMESYLSEEGYRDWWKKIDWDFIHMNQHFGSARNRGSKYIPYNPSNPSSASNGQYLLFKTKASPDSNERYNATEWNQTIKILNFGDSIKLMDKNPRDRVVAMISGDLAMHCNCPAFKWWGYSYLVTKANGHIYPQTIYPKVRNPQLRGIMCKHLGVVMQVMPFYISDITRDLKKQGYLPPKQSNTP